MITIEFPDYSAVYIDHKELINVTYNSTEDEPANYQLKSHLFNYRPVVHSNTDIPNPKKRKRKHNHDSLSPEILKIKNACNDLLPKLKDSCKFNTDDSTFGNESRIWEESSDFPQLRGVNNTKYFQKYDLLNRKYIIPAWCTFFNHNIESLNEIADGLGKFDFVVLDPPWRNKYIRRIKKAKQELGYKMMEDDVLAKISLDKLIHCDSIVAIWCTNSQQHQRTLLQELLPQWDLHLVHKIVWLKLNVEGNLIGDLKEDGQKQPFEILFIACHRNCKKDFSRLKKVDYLLSVPSIIHSHKPPIVQLFQDYLPPCPTCLELFARYLQPGFTSIGLEVLKLMDVRLYNEQTNIM